MLKKLMIGSLLISNVAFGAAETTLTTALPEREPRNFSLMVEGDSVILGGAGLKGTYRLSDKVALGLSGRMYKMKSDSSSSISADNSYQHDLSVVGLYATYLPWSSYDRLGFYITGGVSSASVKTNVTDSYFGEGSSTDSKVGADLRLGYQFAFPISRSLGMIFQTGAGYGNGGGVRWSAFTGKNTRIEDSVLFDLTAGMQF